MDGSKEEKGSRQKAKRFLMIIAGIWLLLFIMCSFVIYLFFPDLLHPETQKAETTTELYAMEALHKDTVRHIDAHRQKKGGIPADMKAGYDCLPDRQIKKAQAVNVLQVYA